MKTYDTYNTNLREEAAAFDSQIMKRIKVGHIPDIENTENCDYFYNNPWRRKYYAELDFGEQRDLVVETLLKNLSQKPKDIKILEVGSGPGYMSLALARKGYHVTGLELSSECIDVATTTAEKYSPGLIGSNLEYICDDFFKYSESHPNEFDVVIFIGAMHHFPNQEEINSSCRNILKQNGLLICHEPVRDCVSRRNAILNLLITTLLAASGSYFKRLEKEYESCIQTNIERIFNELRYELEDGDKAQSVNDNEAGYNEMYPLLQRNFIEIDFQWRYGLFHEIIGGIRLATEDDEASLAKFIRDIDQVMCRENVVDPTEFFFVGKNK
jgi:2-polyprenyl-3-methyl-5-hydroxy-6-metoxy-1,4-benzoquinol methylase